MNSHQLNTVYIPKVFLAFGKQESHGRTQVLRRYSQVIYKFFLQTFHHFEAFYALLGNKFIRLLLRGK